MYDKGGKSSWLGTWYPLLRWVIFTDWQEFSFMFHFIEMIVEMRSTLIDSDPSCFLVVLFLYNNNLSFYFQEDKYMSKTS